MVSIIQPFPEHYSLDPTSGGSNRGYAITSSVERCLEVAAQHSAALATRAAYLAPIRKSADSPHDIKICKTSILYTVTPHAE